MSRLLAWFASKNGKRFTHSCVGITAVSIIGGHFAIHGPLMEKIKSLSQIYSDGKPRPLSAAVEELVNTVLKDSKMKREEKKKLKFYNVIGQDLCHFGDVRSPYGAMVGIPFMFEDINNVNFGQLRLVGQDPIDWIVDGHDFLRAITLSDNAKKFGIMREIKSCSLWTVLDTALVGAGAIIFAAELSRRTNIKWEGFKRPLKKRLTLYVLCYLMSYFVYRFLRDPTKHISEKNTDQLTAAVGPQYLEGGIEFYEKALARNKALRKLMGPRGEKMFDKDGNENYFIFPPRLPIRKRLELLQDIRKELQTVAA